MWQGASRIRADRIEIDREARRLVASGSVQTQLLEKAKKETPTKPCSAYLYYREFRRDVYTDTDRLAHHTGGTLLTRQICA